MQIRLQIAECIDNLGKIYGSQLGLAKGSIVRMEVNNLDIAELHEWDGFDDEMNDMQSSEYNEIQNMVANEKTFVYSMDTSSFGPAQAFIKFRAGFKKAVKSGQFQLPTNVTDCYVYALLDNSGHTGFEQQMSFDIPNSKFDIGMDKWSDAAKYLKNAHDLRKVRLSLNPTHELSST